MTQPYPDHIRLGPGEDSVILLDQTQLPNRLEERQVRSLSEMIEAIRSLRVRGAPAIGIFAGYCLYVLAGQLERQGLTGADGERQLIIEKLVLAISLKDIEDIQKLRALLEELEDETNSAPEIDITVSGEGSE